MKKHVECTVVKNKEHRRVYVPVEVAKVGRIIKVQGVSGWKITQILSKPEYPPYPFEEGPLA